jgi:uncharacterized protein (DUF433 family)
VTISIAAVPGRRLTVGSFRRILSTWRAPSAQERENVMNPLLQRISVDPNVCFGKPCIRGSRIWVSLLLDFLASGMSHQDALTEYPQLTEEDIRAAIAYGAEMSRERYVDIAAR